MQNLKAYSIPRYPSDSFTWIRWLLGIKIWRELGIACREQSIFDNKDILRKHAIGYREGEKLFCRPKSNEVAVLFIVDDVYCWTHLRKKEFEYVFSE